MRDADLASFSEGGLKGMLLAVPAARRARGELLARSGAVLRSSGQSRLGVRAKVSDGPASMTVVLAGTHGFWNGMTKCSCGGAPGCEHTAAVAYALLEIFRTRRPERVSREQASATLTRWAAGAAGRSLEGAELGFLQGVHALYLLHDTEPIVTVQDLAELGMHGDARPTEGGGIVQWPEPAFGPVEFWCCLGLAADLAGGVIPEFLAEATRREPAYGRAAAERRRIEAAAWRERFGREGRFPRDDAVFAEEVELRLRFGPAEASLEWRPAGAAGFSPLKPSKFLEFDDEFGDRLSAPSAMLWAPILERARFSRDLRLRYGDTAMDRLLSRLLRPAELRPLIVDRNGGPFRWEQEPLRWTLTEVADGADYQLRLVRPDGSPPPPELVRLPGRPPLLVSLDSVWRLPAESSEILDRTAANTIPAVAFEDAAGVKFLQRHGVPVPPALARRTRTHRLAPLVRAEMEGGVPGGANERAVVRVVAVRDDGEVAMRLWRDHWLEDGAFGAPSAAGARSGAPGQEPPATIELLDYSALAPVPATFEPAGFKWDENDKAWTLKAGGRFAGQFHAWIQALPKETRFEVRGDLATLLTGTVSGRISVSVANTEIDWFDLSVSVSVSEPELTPEEVELLLRTRGRWVRLGDKGWRRLEFEISPEEDAQFAKLGLNPRQTGAEPQRLHALQLAHDSARGLLGEQAHDLVVRRASEIQASVTPPPPPSLKAELRPYQTAGFHFLCYLATNRFGGVLADDMGLGKTLQTLAWMAWLDDERRARPAATGGDAPGPSPFLVVCPKSVADNWRAEAERFTPGLKVTAWSADTIATMPSRLASADIHVINYAQLRTVGPALASVPFHAVVLDEGQYIKNPAGQTAKAARALRSPRRLVLTGTPIENRLSDLWSLMAFAMPGALGSRAEFQRLFDVKDDPLARQRLAARVRPFLLRRTKSQVARDLPDRIEEDLYCEMEGEQRALYQAELKRAQAMLMRIRTPEALQKERFHFLTSLLRLRQICCHPALVLPEAAGPGAKVEALFERLEPLLEDGQRILVFSQFLGLLEILRAAMVERGWSHFYLTGDTEDRGELVRSFQTCEGGAVFLISLKAGGSGLNLTAAGYVVLFDPWWNPAVEAQAIDRSHRIGQTQKVIAYRLLIKDSIEEKIRALQRGKSQLAQDILGEENFAKGLTLTDFQFLLEG